MADPEVWRALLEAGNPYLQRERQQRGLMGMMELQEKKRALEDAQKLRDLYASGENVTFNKAAAIDPVYAQKMQQFNNEQLLKQYQMLESQVKIEENQRKATEAKQHTFANTIGPLVENWQEGLGGRQPSAQDLESFKGRLGGALKFLDEAYGYKPDVAMDPYHPEHILGTAETLGYASRRAKAAEAQQGAYAGGVGRAQAPVPAGVHMTPQGPMIAPGLPTGMPNQPNLSQFGPATKANAQDIPMLEEAYKTETDPNRKFQIGKTLNDLRQQSGFVTPTQARDIRIGEKEKEAEIQAEKELKVTEGKQKLEEREVAKKAMNAYEMLPEPDRIRNLIKGSIGGDTEYWANRLGGVVGKSLESGDITEALKVIEGKMAETVAMFPGAQSDKELEARMKTIGRPSAEVSPDSRLKAFDEWLNMMQKYVAQHATYDNTQLLDMVNEGKLTKDQALRIFQNRTSGGK